MLSIAFIRDMGRGSSMALLQWSWITFAISIVATVIAMVQDRFHRVPRMVAARLDFQLAIE